MVLKGIMTSINTIWSAESMIPPKQEVFEAFPMDKRLCVVECLWWYEGKTTCFHSGGLDQRNRSFPWFIKPHRVDTSQTLAHWIRITIKDEGIDYYLLGPLSSWSLQHNTAVEKEVLIADILRTADWSKDSMYLQMFLLSPNFRQWLCLDNATAERREEGKMLMRRLCPLYAMYNIMVIVPCLSPL